MNELVDFQSMVVLSKTKKDGEAQVAIDKFIQHFAWAQALATALWQLREAGHFDYTLGYSAILSLVEDPEAARHQALEMQKLHQNWVAHVEYIRRAFYFANFYR